MFRKLFFHPKVIALLQECKHCVCEGCLISLIESSKDAKNSMKSIYCPDLDCMSFVTVKTAEDFLGNTGNPHRPVYILSH